MKVYGEMMDYKHLITIEPDKRSVATVHPRTADDCRGTVNHPPF